VRGGRIIGRRKTALEACLDPQASAEPGLQCPAIERSGKGRRCLLLLRPAPVASLGSRAGDREEVGGDGPACGSLTRRPGGGKLRHTLPRPWTRRRKRLGCLTGDLPARDHTPAARPPSHGDSEDLHRQRGLEFPRRSRSSACRIRYKLVQEGHGRFLEQMAFEMSDEERRELDELTLEQVKCFMKVPRRPPSSGRQSVCTSAEGDASTRQPELRHGDPWSPRLSLPCAVGGDAEEGGGKVVPVQGRQRDAEWEVRGSSDRVPLRLQRSPHRKLRRPRRCGQGVRHGRDPHPPRVRPPPPPRTCQPGDRSNVPSGTATATWPLGPHPPAGTPRPTSGTPPTAPVSLTSAPARPARRSRSESSPQPT